MHAKDEQIRNYQVIPEKLYTAVYSIYAYFKMAQTSRILQHGPPFVTI